MEEQRENVGLHIEDALRPVGIPIYSGSDTLEAIAREVEAAAPGLFFLRMADGSWYVMSQEEFRAMQGNYAPATRMVETIGRERAPNLFPDMPIDSAIPHLARWAILPIQNRAIRGALEGTITLPEILARYQQP